MFTYCARMGRPAVVFEASTCTVEPSVVVAGACWFSGMTDTLVVAGVVVAVVTTAIVVVAVVVVVVVVVVVLVVVVAGAGVVMTSAACQFA